MSKSILVICFGEAELTERDAATIASRVPELASEVVWVDRTLSLPRSTEAACRRALSVLFEPEASWRQEKQKDTDDADDTNAAVIVLFPPGISDEWLNSRVFKSLVPAAFFGNLPLTDSATGGHAYSSVAVPLEHGWFYQP